MAKLPEIISDYSDIPDGSWMWFKYYGIQVGKSTCGFLFHSPEKRVQVVSGCTTLFFEFFDAEGMMYTVEYVNTGDRNRWSLVKSNGSYGKSRYPMWLHSMLSPDSEVLYDLHLP